MRLKLRAYKGLGFSRIVAVRIEGLLHWPLPNDLLLDRERLPRDSNILLEDVTGLAHLFGV